MNGNVEPKQHESLPRELVKAAVIGLVTAVVTSYANQAVLGERINNLSEGLRETKAQVSQIYRDMYCPQGRCPPAPPQHRVNGG